MVEHAWTDQRGRQQSAARDRSSWTRANARQPPITPADLDRMAGELAARRAAVLAKNSPTTRLIEDLLEDS